MMATHSFVLNLKAITIKIFILIILPLLGVYAAKQVFNAVRAPKIVEFYYQPLVKLVPMIAGKQIHVPREYGIYSTRLNESILFIAGADKVGESAFVDLCTQKTKSKDFPNKIFPLYVLGQWADLSAIKNKSLKTPIILGPEADAGFPNLEITGEVQSIQNHLDDLKLTKLENTEHAQMIYDKGKQFDKDAWVVWNKTPSTDSNRYQSALHIKRAPLKGCDSGQLEFELFLAKQELIPQDKKMQVWVFSNKHSAEWIWLKPGIHQVPTAVSKIEDQALFESAVQSGLIQLSKHTTALIAPQDLFEAISMGLRPEGWKKVVVNQQNKDILKRLYHKSDGDYVRQHIKKFNQKSQWAGFRVKNINDNIGNWTARVDGYYSSLNIGMPEVIARLYTEPPTDWNAWAHVSMPETSVDVVTISLLPAKNLPELEVELLGRFVAATGSQSAQSLSICSNKECDKNTQISKVLLSGIQAGKLVEIKLTPNLTFAKLAKSAAEFNPVYISNNQLKWTNSPQLQPNTYQFSKTTIKDRNGLALFENDKPTDAAKAANISALIGFSTSHSNALSGILGRLGEHGYSQVNAKLTLDARMQTIAQSIVNCVGLDGLKIDSETGLCTNQPISKKHDEGHNIKGRQAGLLLMDAGTGEILASAGNLFNPDRYVAQEVFAFDRFNPETSPLKIRNWQHSGSLDQAPGSTFKLVTALALEDVAKTNKSIADLLAGQNAHQITTITKARGDTFNLQSACYPSPCSEKGAKVTNYREHTPISYTQSGAFGLRQALSFSINTWFAWLSEQTDTTLSLGKHQLAQAVGKNALDQQRPISKLAHQLGFSSAIRLDAGLMPSTFKWQAEDTLQTTASNFDPIHDQHNVRQQAIGLRAQVTPLQMAMVAASIGEGKYIKPRLLMQLNETIAAPSKFSELQIPLTRIREGMKDVVETGTAAFVFDQSMQSFKRGLYAKTGTAPMKHLGEHINTAWFIGYIEPNTIQGETRRLAFAAWVTRTPLTGGEHTAPMMAAFMQQLNHSNSEKSQ